MTDTRMAKRTTGWICACGTFGTSEPWGCPGCGTEVCEVCFDIYMHCRKCSESQPDKSLIKAAAEQMYCVEFDNDDND